MFDNGIFTCSTKYIDCSSQIVQEQADLLFGGCPDEIEKAKAAYLFVRDRIPHTFDIGVDTVTASASEVLKSGTGICHAKSNLLAALLRTQGIPAGLCYQHITLADDDSRGYCLHCLNGVYLDGHWVLLDARGNTNGKNAQFSTGDPVLAFASRAGYDEYLFDGIWALPDSPTMKLLSTAKTLKEVMDGLPEKPEGMPDIFPLS